jgi:hypothetical protein
MDGIDWENFDMEKFSEWLDKMGKNLKDILTNDVPLDEETMKQQFGDNWQQHVEDSYETVKVT